jgi:hypothetical protein
MAGPGEKLAESLVVLRKIQKEGALTAIKTSEISRVHRERLTKNGFLKKVTKGWYIPTEPREKQGKSTSWYTSYWQFCARYLEEKYGDEYTISAEQSILLHSGNDTVPSQMVIRTPKAHNKPLQLLYNTSLFIMTSPLPKIAEIEEKNDVRCLTLTSALIHCTPSMYDKSATDMRSALAHIPDSSEITRLLLEGSHSVIAGRLAGAFRLVKTELQMTSLKQWKQLISKSQKWIHLTINPKLNYHFAKDLLM